MNDRHAPTPPLVGLAPTDSDESYARMLESAAALISFYGQQIPGCSVERQRALTRAMRRIRNDRTKVLPFDRRMILEYLHHFDQELAEQRTARQSTPSASFDQPPTNRGTVFASHPGALAHHEHAG